MKFKNYAQFNESIADIFRGAHAAVNPDDLTPLKELVGKPKFPTEEEFDEAVSFLKADPDYFFYDSTNVLHPNLLERTGLSCFLRRS